MRNRVWLVVAAVGAIVGSARAQPAPSPDPFGAAIFQPLPAADPTLADATAANSPRAVVPAPCPCEPGYSTWASAELLIGRTRGPSVAPVVTTGPVAAGALAGSVGVPGTVSLFGGKRLLDDWRTGLRVEAGAWLDPQHRLGVGARLYSLFSASERFRAVPNGAVVINVPQTVSAGGARVQVPAFVGFPGLTTGRVGASVQTTFAGGDLNLRVAAAGNDRGRVELLAGYRQLYLADDLAVNFAVAPVAGGPAGVSLAGADAVRTRNSFYGPQLGLLAATGGDRVWAEGHAAAALGVTASAFDFARTRDAGVALAPLPLTRANVSDRLSYFGAVAEGGARLNWRAAEHVRLTAGYSFLYWNEVRRAQEMFAAGAVFRPRAIDFATHLFSVGLDVRF